MRQFLLLSVGCTSQTIARVFDCAQVIQTTGLLWRYLILELIVLLGDELETISDVFHVFLKGAFVSDFPAKAKLFTCLGLFLLHVYLLDKFIDVFLRVARVLELSSGCGTLTRAH